MNCREVRSRLAAAVTGQLAIEEARAVADHLAGCDACRAEWERLMQVENQVHVALRNQSQRLAVPVGGWARLQAATGRQPRTAGPLVLPIRITLAGLAALLLVGLLAPSVFAQMAAVVGGWFQIQAPNTTTQVSVGDFKAFSPFAPTYLPAGFDLTTTGVHTAPEQDEFRLVYQHAGDTILLLQRVADGPLTALAGVTVVLSDTTAVLAADPAGFNPVDLAFFKSQPPNILVWDRAGVRLELLADLPTSELAQIANSMQPASR